MPKSTVSLLFFNTSHLAQKIEFETSDKIEYRYESMYSHFLPTLLLVAFRQLISVFAFLPFPVYRSAGLPVCVAMRHSLGCLPALLVLLAIFLSGNSVDATSKCE